MFFRLDLYFDFITVSAENATSQKSVLQNSRKLFRTFKKICSNPSPKLINLLLFFYETRNSYRKLWSHQIMWQNAMQRGAHLRSAGGNAFEVLVCGWARSTVQTGLAKRISSPPQSSVGQCPVAPQQVTPYTGKVRICELSTVLMRCEAFSSRLLGSTTALLVVCLASQFPAFFLMYVQIAIKTVD